MSGLSLLKVGGEALRSESDPDGAKNNNNKHSELLPRRRSSSLWGALSTTSGMLTRNLRSSRSTVMVLGLQQREVLRRHAVDLGEESELRGVVVVVVVVKMVVSRRCAHLEDQVSLLQRPLLGGEPRVRHVLDEDLAPELQAVL
ncbi:hypothetical protein EYF80_023035 [Liparis tanakae]|uniref:Uncharacterized protein n=1 Tax=Liparis tanakae TaxID=230148 RepID=A0A4Z2HP82_9TELE|nr:hypothetical protein EYF80_023035 [Liparis tanakae]